MDLPEATEDPLAEVTLERLERYLRLTANALEKARVVAPERSFAAKIAASYRDMAERYYEDARTFAGQGDRVNAFACVNYAHGWLDAGARLGVFEVEGDDQLFTLLE
jgi:uncharacterized protein